MLRDSYTSQGWFPGTTTQTTPGQLVTTTPPVFYTTPPSFWSQIPTVVKVIGAIALAFAGYKIYTRKK